MKYFLIAGEASGDLHASQLIHAFKAADANAEFRFLGGGAMEREAGCKPLIHCREMAYMGFIEVAKHLKTILGIMSSTKRAIADWKPDAVILIDYPSFNLKIARYAHSLGIPVFYYISPKVWAWKEYRVKEIKKYVTRLYSILPFEKAFFARHNYEISYVGNPSVNEMDREIAKIPSFADFCNRHSLPADLPIVALLPGSRRKEISDNLPEMVKSTYSMEGIRTVIAAAPDIEPEFYSRVVKREGSYPVPPVVAGDTFALVRNSRAALVTSGTATLETALLGTPQIACYRMNGNRLVYQLYKHLLKVRFVTLPNLITDSEIIPELLLHFCNKENITRLLSNLLQNSPMRDAMLNGYKNMREILTDNDSAANAVADIIKILKNDRQS